MALNPNLFVDGVMNGFSLHIEPPSYEYLYFPSEDTKHIKAKGKGGMEVLIQRYCLHKILSMFYISKV